MEIYLAIITTVLVATQIVRLIQNSMQLKKYAQTNKTNNEIRGIYEKIEQAVDIYLYEVNRRN